MSGGAPLPSEAGRCRVRRAGGPVHECGEPHNPKVQRFKGCTHDCLTTSGRGCFGNTATNRGSTPSRRFPRFEATCSSSVPFHRPETSLGSPTGGTLLSGPEPSRRSAGPGPAASGSQWGSSRKPLPEEVALTGPAGRSSTSRPSAVPSSTATISQARLPVSLEPYLFLSRSRPSDPVLSPVL